MTPQAELQDILVLEPDRLRGAVLARTISSAFPGARVYCESEPFNAAALLAEGTISLFVVALRGFDLDILTLLGVWADHDAGKTRVLVVTPDANSSALMAVAKLPITGVFDAGSGDMRELELACRTIASGETYWSRSVKAKMSAAPMAVASEIQTLPPPKIRTVRQAPPSRRRRRSNDGV